MAGIYGISAYQQTSRPLRPVNARPDGIKQTAASKAGQTDSPKESISSRIETKEWSPVDAAGSLVPKKTEYGNTIGGVQLSEKAKDYYDQLKSKYHNMEFIAVSKDMKEQVKKNAASYGNANKMVVLIDEEKLERMAGDESFRKQYEGIIEMSQSKLAGAKNSLASSGAAVKNFGMSVDEDGSESFFATVEKAGEQQKKRIERKAAEKKELKAKEKKKAEKEAKEERLKKAKEKNKAEKAEPSEEGEASEEITEPEDNREYVTIEAKSLEELFSKVQDYSFRNASERVMAEEERMLGTHVDFRG